MFRTSVIRGLLAVGCLTFGPGSYAATPTDSVGIERQLGEVFVLHQVSEGETLFAISQRYGVSIDDLRALNQAANLDKLDIGDTLRIPMFPQLAKGKKAHHTVAEGETLFALSQKYGAAIDDIRRWNALGEAPIAIGQELVVYLDVPSSEESTLDTARYALHTVDEGETLYAIARAYGVAVDELRERNDLANESLQFGQTLVIREKAVPPGAAAPEVTVAEVTPAKKTPMRVASPPPVASNEAAASDLPSNAPPPRLPAGRSAALEAERQRFERIKKEEQRALEEIETVSEMGFASVIEGGSATKKYLALHRSAPAGTVLRVRNEMNEMSVFVRVVGKLPDTGVNDKINIRLTPAAYQKLGGIDERFPVEISYLK